MLFVQHNLLAENANRQFKVSTGKNAKLTEKLSSGYKINRAADDAAGLSISEKMRRQVRGLHQTVDNISEGVGYVQTAEGALNEVHDMLQRINELAVKAANGTNTVEDRAAIDAEIQHLKNEMNRIFSETTFNEQKIWEPREKKILGYDQVRAVTEKGREEPIMVTNKNYDVIPCGNPIRSTTNSGAVVDVEYYGYFTVHADVADGIHISWTGFGINPDTGQPNKYETEAISWDQLKEQNYSFEMSTLFNKDKYPDLFDGDKPVFEHRVAFSPAETATIEDMADCLDGCRISTRARAAMHESWNNQDLRLAYPVLHYSAAYASNAGDAINGHNFDAADDLFLEPVLVNGTNLTGCPDYTDELAARDDTDGWEFSFYMEGIGEVKGTSTGISYWANDQEPEHENFWWRWYTYKDSYGVEHTVKRQIVKHAADGTLAGLMSILTGDESDTRTPGILSQKENGCSKSGGMVEIKFELKTDSNSNFKYTTQNGTIKNDASDVGSFYLRFSVSNTERERDVWNRVKDALNKSSVLDFATTGAEARTTFGLVYPRYKGIQAPIYGGICGFYVQAGTEGGQHISVQYEALSTLALGIGDTNVRTIESASRAIDEVKGALQMVSEQRSTFGAYQNRLEHATNINANVEENTQAAESRIRDADIADLMMEYSINNILMQAGTSMLTQANQSSQSILELLQ